MAKAITTTADNKARNPKYLGTSTIGQIGIFTTMPKVWRTENWTKEAFDLAVSFHEEAGFYEVVSPAYDPNTQKLGALFFDVDKFTYPIIAMTQQEIDDKVAQEEDATAEGEVNTKESDGQSEIRYIFRMLKKLHTKGTLTNNQYNQSRALMFDALLPLYFGQWEISQTKLNAVVNPANATLLNILNQIKARITYYVTNNVRQDE